MVKRQLQIRTFLNVLGAVSRYGCSKLQRELIPNTWCGNGKSTAVVILWQYWPTMTHHDKETKG